MSCTLITMRHGEAEPQSHKADRQRQLTERGRIAATSVGQVLVKEGLLPVACLVSPAARAQATAAAIKAVCGPIADWRVASVLYEGDAGRILDLVAGLSEKTTIALLVGHNPTLSLVASVLAGASVTLGTAEAAVLQAPADSWQEAMRLSGAWALARLIAPTQG